MQSDWLPAFKKRRLAKSRSYNVESAHKHSLEASEDAMGCRKRWGHLQVSADFPSITTAAVAG